MFGADVLFDCPDLHVADLTIEADAVTIHVESTAIVAGGRQAVSEESTSQAASQ